MKKYKLIKEYPGSIKLGEILEVEETGNTLFSVSCLYKGISTAIPRAYVLQYPEFWQEVSEKDYEILSFKTNCGDIEYVSKNDKHILWLTNGYNCKIHSIKRL